MADYDTDLLLWSEHQAALLRRMGAGEHVNDQVDWSNVAEEIESLGISDKRQLRSRLGTWSSCRFRRQANPVQTGSRRSCGNAPKSSSSSKAHRACGRWSLS